jgi:radical SAM superfamily enzyme YgiQ (UPF0313 family)
MKTKNILLIAGPAVKLKIGSVNLAACRTSYPKISQLILAAIIEKEVPNAKIQILDMKLAGSTNEVKFKEINYGLNKIDVYRVGQDFSEIKDKVRQSNAILFTNNFTHEAGVVGDLIEFCKKVNPKAKIFVGGADASVKSKYINRQAYFYSRGADCVAAGDGEIMLPELLKKQSRKENLKLLDLDSVPFPSFDSVDLSSYTESPEGPLPKGIKPPFMYLETSRGCTQMCDFCATPFTKGRYRFMSHERIEETLRYYKSAGIKNLLLCEDNILSRLDVPNGRENVLDWFNYMRKNGFVWEFSNGIELGKLTKDGAMDEELITTLFSYNSSTGCYRTYIPLERLDTPAYRKLKPFKTEKEILATIVHQKVPRFNIGVIIGNPKESQKSLKIIEKRLNEIMTLVSQESAGKATAYANIFLHTPLPGSLDYDRFLQEGRLAFDINKTPELFNFYTSVINGDTFSCYEMTELRKKMALRINGEEAFKIWQQTGKYHY